MIELLAAQLSFLPAPLVTVLMILLKILIIVLPLMGCVAYTTLVERSNGPYDDLTIR